MYSQIAHPQMHNSLAVAMPIEFQYPHSTMPAAHLSVSCTVFNHPQINQDMLSMLVNRGGGVHVNNLKLRVSISDGPGFGSGFDFNCDF